MMRRLSLYSVTVLVLFITVITGCGITRHPTSQTITANGNSLHFEMNGSGDQSLVLIHGWSNTLHFWDGQIEEISKTCRVVAVDLPGFGASINHRDDWTMASFGSDVAAVIDHLKLKETILVGFSMGGPVSIEAAKHAPGKIKGIILVDVIQNPETTYPQDQVTGIANMYMDAVTYPDMMKVKPFFRTQKDQLGAPVYRHGQRCSQNRMEGVPRQLFFMDEHIGGRLHQTPRPADPCHQRRSTADGGGHFPKILPHIQGPYHRRGLPCGAVGVPGAVHPIPEREH